ncbi:MAG: hypothetical protein P8I79_08390, partial [Amylibacter sp.]|nr:hypothetical protein [Amylibacter sp.]
SSTFTALQNIKKSCHACLIKRQTPSNTFAAMARTSGQGLKNKHSSQAQHGAMDKTSRDAL